MVKAGRAVSVATSICRRLLYLLVHFVRQLFRLFASGPWQLPRPLPSTSNLGASLVVGILSEFVKPLEIRYRFIAVATLCRNTFL
jgi:hypothetical protein